MTVDRLRPGERVALRAPENILSTLDAQGALEGVPFMPEMLPFFGQALTVAKRAEKICDTICPTASRRMRSSVYLDNLRCDGAAHGGCQAECRIYWKEAWLVRLNTGPAPPPPAAASLAALRAVAQAQTGLIGRPELFRCQATEARRATTELPGWDMRQYAREVTSGNVTLWQLLWVTLRAVPAELRRLFLRGLPRAVRRLGRRLQVHLSCARSAERERPVHLDLKPGEWVEVRSAAEIARTLDVRGFNRGLSFTSEMTLACGKRFRVRRRISHIIDEPTGRMLHMKHDCIVLEGMVCTGDRSVGRWFCAREIYPYWREAWLKRLSEPTPAGPAARTRSREPSELPAT